MKFLLMITGFAARPSVGVVAGFFLAIASAAELRESLVSFSEGIKGEHGMFLYGLMVLLKSLGEMHEGLEEIGEGLDHEPT